MLTFSLSVKVMAQSDWIKIAPDEHNFELSFYQTPLVSVDSSAFQGEPLFTYSWELDVTDSLHSNKYYSVVKTDYPADYIHSDSLFNMVEGFINSTQNYLVENDEFDLLSSTLDETNGFPGKIFKWKNVNNNVHLQFRVYLINHSLFQISAVAREGEEQNISLGRFFGSFKVVGIPNGNFQILSNNDELTYSIKFKKEPTEENKVVDSEYGKLSMDIKMLELKDSSDPNLFYIAMETKYPTDVVKDGDTYGLNRFYKKAIDGSLAAVNGVLISIEDVYYDSYLGKEYRFYYAGGQILMVYRLFYVDGSLYQHGVITEPKKDKNEGMNRFFKSFKLLKTDN